jgi:phenylalanyl-tRNA synthetase beta chain
MKFPLSLLKRFLDTDASLARICEVATAIGLEVESVENQSEALKPFVVAEILAAEKHPGADKLRVCKVQTAEGALQIVCGAANARAGIKVALAKVGSVIPRGQMEIKKSAIRGVESCGMLCSADELGLGRDSEGIIELPADAEIGASIVDALGLNDPVIDLAITANRGDCMGVYGIARDLAAAGLGTLKPLCVPAIAEHEPFPLTIAIHHPGCRAFSGRVIRGVKNGASPLWMQRTLEAARMRPISVLVDITNYFTLAFGRPLHVFDLAKLAGGIEVRAARKGETLAALNDKSYSLTSDDMVIADEKGALALAGIIGGTASGVTEETTDVLLEVALFDPLHIARSGRHHQIESDARARFERGVDAGFVEIANARATDLILELCGGKASAAALAGNVADARTPIPFDAAAINALGGTEIPEVRMKEILTALGFAVAPGHVTTPSWRHDVAGMADLAEEVLRITGYETITPVSLPKPITITRAALTPTQKRLALLKRVAATRGLNEIQSWGFCSHAEAAAFGGQQAALALINPISAELSVMRPNLLPHLVRAAARNASRGQSRIALFEAGAVFHGMTPQGQQTMVAGLRAGLRHGLAWQGSPEVDWLDAKADLFALLEAAGIDTAKLTITRTVPGWYHPGRAGAVGLGPKNILGFFGELHPATLQALDCEMRVVACELKIDALPLPRPTKRKALSVSNYQPVTRDFAFVMDAVTPAADLVIAVNKAEKTLIRSVAIFDVYQGKNLPEGKKSIALCVTLQADDRTLTDAEIENVTRAIITSATTLGAVLR